VTIITQVNAGKIFNSFFFNWTACYCTKRRYEFDLLKFRLAHGL
jgi:hypothetical protein